MYTFSYRAFIARIRFLLDRGQHVFFHVDLSRAESVVPFRQAPPHDWRSIIAKAGADDCRNRGPNRGPLGATAFVELFMPFPTNP
jgi:hypothetical protein